MKKLLFLLPLIAIISCGDPDNPNRAKFNNSGCLECDNYLVGESFIVGGLRYEVADRAILETAIADGDDLTRYCTSRIGNMGSLFTYNQSFNQDISSWDVSNVTDMNSIFKGATAFNQDIVNWDVSNVTDMKWMFVETSFNQDIGSWDVSNVTNMYGMFSRASAFNQDIGSWDVSNVTDMNGMFRYTTNFNQDLTQWCVSNINSIPTEFSTNSALTASNHPIWGTCP